MELTFNKVTCPCLRKVVRQVQNQEQTQEVRLPDAMPDIGRVLGSWGQVLIRSKEWRSNAFSVSGGVMAWVLYAPEDGSEPRSIETWIPFQMKWELPQMERDGTICVTPLLKAVDARSTSARKLMVRVNVSVLGEAMEPTEPEVCIPEQIPEDVQLLRQSYPVELPREAGEKLFQMDEELSLPGSFPQIQKILRWEWNPQIAEQKVMAGRLVFRGKGTLYMLCGAADGTVHNWETELPFSQYTELDRDYGPNASAWVMPMLTSLELDLDDQNRLQLKCAIAAQYVIYDRQMIDIVEDAYSPVRQISAETQELKIPMRLDIRQETLQMSAQCNAEGQKILDICWLPDHLQVQQEGDETVLTVPGQFQVLYYDENGSLQCANVRSEAIHRIPSDPGNLLDGYVRFESRPQAVLGAQTIECTGLAVLETAAFAEQGLHMITELELGETKEPDPLRPSLILRRAGENRLWDIAKECGSTVDAIRKANQLQQEPDSDRMLLIPVP